LTLRFTGKTQAKYPQPGQDGFRQAWTEQGQKVGNIFRVSFNIQDNVAAGTWDVTQIRAVINPSLPIELVYLKSEFSATTFKIDNPNAKEKPKVDITVH
jgi:hypothetical protein